MADGVEGEQLVLQGLEGYIKGLRKAAEDAAGEIAALLESYAKTHHPWTPRTGATDASTRGFVAENSEKLILIVLTAGMDYDKFLELAHGGKWAWLWPAVIDNKTRIKQILQKRMGRRNVRVRRI